MVWFALPLLAFAIATVPLVVIDLKEHRLPNRITLPLVPILIVLLAIAAWGTGEWDRFTRSLLAGLVLLMVYLVLHLIYPAGLGFGDVKLAASIGLVLGWLSWDAVLWGTFAAFLLSAVVSIALLVARRATIKTAIAFGPFMLVGAWLVVALALLS
jgi:leader peptidase (prepilin peptidase) / N-methyltransferase